MLAILALQIVLGNVEVAHRWELFKKWVSLAMIGDTILEVFLFLVIISLIKP